MPDRERKDGGPRHEEAPPLPDRLPGTVADSHCHLDLHTSGGPAGSEVLAALDKAVSVGVDRIVQVGVDVASSRWSVECANAFPGRVVAAVALHPNDAPLIDGLDDALEEIDQLASDPRVRAIGETGLDFFRTAEPLRDKQRYSFEQHIAIAKKHGKALMIHDRDAHSAVFDVLERVGAPEKVIFHCFSGDAAMAKRAAPLGFMMSFAGTVTFKSAKDLQAALLEVPDDLLLVETDAPFLTPTPHRGRPNASYLIPHTLGFMAQHRGQSLEDLVRVISDNSHRIFGSF